MECAWDRKGSEWEKGMVEATWDKLSFKEGSAPLEVETRCSAWRAQRVFISAPDASRAGLHSSNQIRSVGRWQMGYGISNASSADATLRARRPTPPCRLIPVFSWYVDTPHAEWGHRLGFARDWRSWRALRGWLVSAECLLSLFEDPGSRRATLPQKHVPSRDPASGGKRRVGRGAEGGVATNSGAEVPGRQRLVGGRLTPLRRLGVKVRFGAGGALDRWLSRVLLQGFWNRGFVWAPLEGLWNAADGVEMEDGG